MKLAALVVMLASMAWAQRGPAGGYRGGAIHSGGRTGFTMPPPAPHPAHVGRTVIVPYPVYYTGGYYGYDPSLPLATQSAPAYDADPNGYSAGYAGQSPVVVINQGFRPDLSNVDAPPPESNVRIYDATPAPRDP